MKSAHFLEVYISLYIIIAATFVTSASSAFLASVALMTELIISDKYIYFCKFQ